MYMFSTGLLLTDLQVDKHMTEMLFRLQIYMFENHEKYVCWVESLCIYFTLNEKYSCSGHRT